MYKTNTIFTQEKIGESHRVLTLHQASGRGDAVKTLWDDGCCIRGEVPEAGPGSCGQAISCGAESACESESTTASSTRGWGRSTRAASPGTVRPTSTGTKRKPPWASRGPSAPLRPLQPRRCRTPRCACRRTPPARGSGRAPHKAAGARKRCNSRSYFHRWTPFSGRDWFGCCM